MSITYLTPATMPTLEGSMAAVTGHRPSKLGNDYRYTSPLTQKIVKRLEYEILRINPEYMISGMALGIDTLWARLAVVSGIPLIAAVPFLDQDVQWPESTRKEYHRLLEQARYVVNVTGKIHYRPEYMQKRNEWMVQQVCYDHRSRLVAVFDGSPGGTKNCVDYAQRVLIPEKIITINPTFL